MTGTTLKIRDATFTKFLFNIRLPTTTGLTHEYIFGNNDAQSTKNHGSLAGVSTVVGVPTYGSYHAVIKSSPSQGYNIGIPAVAQPEVTVIIIMQAVSACPPLCIGGSNPLTGFFGATNPILANANTGTANQPTITMPTHGNYFMLAGTCPLSATHRMSSWISGVKTITPAGAAGGASRGAGSTFIGTAVSGAGLGTANMAYTAIFNRILSDAEIDASYTSLKNFYNGKIVIS